MKNMLPSERLCTLCFDEIYTSQHIEINRKKEKRISTHKIVEEGMVRGSLSKWKQPVYFYLETTITKEVLMEVISKVYDAGFTVVSGTTDLGPADSLHFDEHWSEIKPRMLL